jgi:hypothetical protein
VTLGLDAGGTPRALSAAAALVGLRTPSSRRSAEHELSAFRDRPARSALLKQLMPAVRLAVGRVFYLDPRRRRAARLVAAVGPLGHDALKVMLAGQRVQRTPVLRDWSDARDTRTRYGSRSASNAFARVAGVSTRHALRGQLPPLHAQHIEGHEARGRSAEKQLCGLRAPLMVQAQPHLPATLRPCPGSLAAAKS